MKAILVAFGIFFCAASVFADAWLVVPSPTIVRLNGVVILQDTLVFAAGARGTIIGSTDGGAKWHNETTGLASAMDLRSVAGTNPRAAMAVGIDASIGRVDPNFYWSHNGSGQDDLYAVCNVSEEIFCMVGADGLNRRDSIITGFGYWPDIVRQNVPQHRTLRGVTFLTPNIGITVGDSGSVYVTSSAGVSWSEVNVPSHITLRSVASFNGYYACAVGDSGRMWLTSDKGYTWKNIAPAGLTANLNSVSFSNTGTIVAVGDEGLILLSRDTGRTWRREAVNTFANLYGVSCWQDGQQTNWIAVGDSGTVVRTVYGGSTTAYTKDKTAVDFGDVDVNARKADSLHFTNTGSEGYLTVSAATTLSSFTISPSQVIVEPSATGAVAVNYSPSDTGVVDAAIIIRTDAGWIPDTVRVRGRGMAAKLQKNRDTLRIKTETGGANDSLAIINTGNANLVLTIAGVSDSNIIIHCDSIVKPGDSVYLGASARHSVFVDDTSFCVLATNDFRHNRDTIYIVAQKAVGIRNESQLITNNLRIACYPNPCSSFTDISFFVPPSSAAGVHATLAVSDCLGRTWERRDVAGTNSRSQYVRLFTSGFPPGAYECSLTGGSTQSHTILIVVK